VSINEMHADEVPTDSGASLRPRWRYRAQAHLHSLHFNALVMTWVATSARFSTGPGRDQPRRSPPRRDRPGHRAYRGLRHGRREPRGGPYRTLNPPFPGGFGVAGTTPAFSASAISRLTRLSVADKASPCRCESAGAAVAACSAGVGDTAAGCVFDPNAPRVESCRAREFTGTTRPTRGSWRTSDASSRTTETEHCDACEATARDA
jgi:hypothetical protein